MAWNRAGTVTVTNGSAVVTGNGTNFSFPNAQPGQAFVGPNGLPMEIASVDSATQLTLAVPYTGATANGQPFAILPTASFANDLALAFAGFKNTYGAMLDSLGQGLFPVGNAAVPAIRFSADQDTGIFNSSPNVLGIAAGGVAAATFLTTRADFAGHIKLANRQSIGLLPDSQTFNFAGAPAALYGMTVGVDIGAGGPATIVAGFGGVIFGAGAEERARIDQNGNFNVGTTGFAHHAFETSRSGVGVPLCVWRQPGVTVAAAYAVDFGGVEGANGANAAFKLGRAATGRSLNASGTVNASGADYAEYMTKAAACGTIAKGDVVGVDRDGLLTDRWADAVSFMVKSTDPSLVGGDTWDAHLGPRPEAPGAEPIAPTIAAGGDDESHAAAHAQFQAAHAAWVDAVAAYQRDLSAWEAAHEVERRKVDRIAYCGQVPVNASGPVAVGDYLVAAQDGDRIKAVAIADAAITFDQYRRRVGRVLAIRDGRPWVDVQHG